MYKEKFAQELKYALGKQTLSSFAKKVDIPLQTLSRYLLCQSEIGVENLCKIADCLDESLDTLTGRKLY